MREGYIKLYRGIIDWEWFSDPPTRDVFIYLLLNASHNRYKSRGITYERGQVPFGRKQLAERLGFSEQQVRTAIKRLKSTNEISIESTNLGSVATIVNYDKYQGETNVINQQKSIELIEIQPAVNQQLTTTKNEKNEKKIDIDYKTLEGKPQLEKAFQDSRLKNEAHQLYLEHFGELDIKKYLDLFRFYSARVVHFATQKTIQNNPGKPFEYIQTVCGNINQELLKRQREDSLKMVGNGNV